MLYRKIIQKINDWYKHNTKALLIDGARQVGKSTVISRYLQDNKISYVSFDLINHKDVLDALNTSSSADQFLLRLSLLTTKELIPNKTVIFIDEIQEADDAITMIKYLVQDGRYRFILSGSLLGIKLKNIESIPVGFMKVIRMYPLDFEEFMIANSVSEKIINYLKECFDELKSVDDIIHKQMLSLFNTYLIVGGMPEAVNEYVTSKNLRKVIDIQHDIDSTYMLDISKYDQMESLLIQDIYHLIPSELNDSNKRFILKQLNNNARFYQYESSFVWLKDSGVGLFVYHIENLSYPLLASKNTLFKLFLCDTGLLCSKLFGNTAIQILNGNVNINFGAIYESVVAQELIAHGYPLFYYNNKKKGELDFVIEEGCNIIPIEVKSGKDYKRHAALSNILSGELNIQKGYVFNNDNIQVIQNKIYLPIYMIMFLQNNMETDDMIHALDLSALI